jgi:hypothetical protein
MLDEGGLGIAGTSFLRSGIAYTCSSSVLMGIEPVGSVNPIFNEGLAITKRSLRDEASL